MGFLHILNFVKLHLSCVGAQDSAFMTSSHVIPTMLVCISYLSIKVLMDTYIILGFFFSFHFFPLPSTPPLLVFYSTSLCPCSIYVQLVYWTIGIQQATHIKQFYVFINSCLQTSSSESHFPKSKMAFWIDFVAFWPFLAIKMTMSNYLKFYCHLSPSQIILDQ